jgi:magnesium chelatase subunit I
VVPRIVDLDALVASTAGQVELEMLDDGREEQVLQRLVLGAVLETFRDRVPAERLGPIVTAFDEGVVVDTGEAVSTQYYVDLLNTVPGLREAISGLDVGESAAGVASGVELVLEGLHLTKRLNKAASASGATYTAR